MNRVQVFYQKVVQHLSFPDLETLYLENYIGPKKHSYNTHILKSMFKDSSPLSEPETVRYSHKPLVMAFNFTALSPYDKVMLFYNISLGALNGSSLYGG